MSRRGGIYRVGDALPPSDMFEEMMRIGRGQMDHFLGGGGMDWQYDPPQHPLPTGRYRYSTSEIRKGQRIDRFYEGPTNVPPRTHHRIGTATRQSAGGRSPNLRNYSSNQTHAQVRVPLWMSASEVERILDSAFPDGIPQEGEIEIVCPNENDENFIVRSRGGRPRAPTQGIAADADFPFIPPDTEPVPASAAAINGLRTKIVSTQESGETCGICMEEKKEGDLVTELRCGHWFDLECVETWLEQNGTCPTCRARVEIAEEHDVAEFERGQQGSQNFMLGLGHDTVGGAQESGSRNRSSNNHYGPFFTAEIMRPPTRNPSAQDNGNRSRARTRHFGPSHGDTSYSPGLFHGSSRPRSDRSHRPYDHHRQPTNNTATRAPRSLQWESVGMLDRFAR